MPMKKKACIVIQKNSGYMVFFPGDLNDCPEI